MADGSGMDVEDDRRRELHPRAVPLLGLRDRAARRRRTGRSTTAAILDYGCDWRLQEHAVLIVAEPEGKIPFVNVTYAGFIGSVTGMNAEQVSIGEMGGGGLGHWEGVPMAFLVRMVAGGGRRPRRGDRRLPRPSADLRVLLRHRRRQDGPGRSAWRRRGTPSAWSRMGETHPRLPHAVEDAVLLSAGDRYEELVRRVKAGHGDVRRRVGPGADGPAGGDEVEPAQRPVRDDDDAGSGWPTPRRTARRPPPSRTTPSRSPSSGPQARDLGPRDPPRRARARPAVAASR